MNERDALSKEYTDRHKPNTRKFEDFLAFENFKNKFENRLKNTESQIGGLFTSEWIEPFFEKFISSSKTTPKSLENFFQFFQNSTKGYKNITFTVFKAEFSRYIHYYYFPKIIDEFLNSQQLLSLNYNGFFHHILIDSVFLLNFIREDDIKPIFDEQYKQWMEKSNKNKFGLDTKDVDQHLKTIFNHNSTGDGSFLYAWSSSESNGIEKYNAAAENDLYKDIEPTEKLLYRFLLSEDSSNKRFTSRETKLLKMIGNSKSLVELGPGGVNKLAEYLNYYPAHFGFANFLKNKKIYLVDVNSDGYKGVKQNLNKIAKSQITEGIEANFFDKDSSGYKASKPCYFMFGGTIGNFSLEQINMLFDSMKSKEILSSTGAMITYFSAPDKNKLDPETYQQEINKIKAMYGDDESNPFFNISARESMSDLVLSGFAALGLDTSKLEYAVEYEESNGEIPSRIKLGAKVKEDIAIKTSDGRSLSKRAGEYIRAVPSARFTDAEFKKLAEGKDFDIIVQQAHNGVAVAALKSKTALNDKYKEIRNIGYSVAIAIALAGGYTGYHTYEENKLAHERIEDHKKEYLYNHGIGIQAAPYYHELYEISDNLSDRFIQYYGSGDLSKEEIIKNIALYLEKFSAGQDRFNKLSKKDLYSADLFLNDFVDQYFYETMFKNGFDNLERQTVSKALISESINTLKYSGPMTEGYNTETNNIYVIHGTLQGLNRGLGNFIEGYMVPHHGTQKTTEITERAYNMLTNPPFKYDSIEYLSDGDLLKSRTPSSILLSKKESINKYGEPSYIFNSLKVEKIVPKDILDTYPKLLFKTINTYIDIHDDHSTQRQIQNMKLTVVSPKEIIELFEKEDLVFQRCREAFIHYEAIDKNKLNQQILMELKRLMILDLYPDGKTCKFPETNINNTGMTQHLIMFLGAYIKSHDKIINQIKDPDKDFPTLLVPQRQ